MPPGMPAERPSHSILVASGTYRAISTTPDGVRYKYGLLMIGISNEVRTLGCSSSEHIKWNRCLSSNSACKWCFRTPRNILLGQGLEFGNQVIHQLQLVLEYYLSQRPHPTYQKKGSSASESPYLHFVPYSRSMSTSNSRIGRTSYLLCNCHVIPRTCPPCRMLE